MINLFVYIEYVECIGKILFAVDYATLEKVSKTHFWILGTGTISIIPPLPRHTQMSFHNSHCYKLQ
jgi:hypothetical protein